jgi:nicotinamidase-related amidase
MPLDLAALVDPAHTAIVTQECQEGVIGARSALPDLAEAVARVDMIPNVARLVRAARGVGVKVVHCLAERRPDGQGANRNARLFKYMEKAPVKLLPGSEATRLVPEIEPQPSDIVLARLHGLSPFHGTELDWILRNEGVRTIVGVGVSLNVAILNLAFDAVNSAYQVVIPRDAVTGYPAEYVEQIFANTLGGVATLTTTDEVLAAWS